MTPPSKHADFPIAPTMRSPADAPGPRANRTIAKILQATRSVFLTRGYSGTTIDEIARVAEISRASFYTYFPTKRDALLALGADSARASQHVVDGFAAIGSGWSDDDLLAFVDDYFAMLDEHGSFALAWTQAAHEDPEIRSAGMKRHLEICRDFGRTVARLRGDPFDDATAYGLAFFSLCERSWSYCRLYRGSIDPEAVRSEVAGMLRATLQSAARP